MFFKQSKLVKRIIFFLFFLFMTDMLKANFESWLTYNEGSVVETFTFENSLSEKKNESGIFLNVEETLEFKFNVPEDGLYTMILEYKINSDQVLPTLISISWENKELTSYLPALWADESKEYPHDRYGNEIVPRQIKIDNFHKEYIKDYSSLSSLPYVFELKKGENSFKVKNISQPITIKSFTLFKYEPLQSYDQYFLDTPKVQIEDTNVYIEIEAEDYNVKTDSFVRPGNQQDPSIHPYETHIRKLNIIDGASWNKVGQRITWTFEVENPGMHYIVFRYSQSINAGISTFRNIYIDEKIPFYEAASYKFPYTGNKYQNILFKDETTNEPFGIWLDKGVHTISLEVDATPLNNIVFELKRIMNDINQTGLEIRKITGGVVDRNRKWDMELYFPGIVQKFENWANQIDNIYNDLEILYNQKPASLVNLKIASDNIRDLLKDPSKIPTQLSKLNEGFSSASNLISETIDILSVQSLTLDRIYILSSPYLPENDVGLFKRFIEGIKRFFYSFFPRNKEYMAVNDKKSDELLVWVNRPIQYVEMLQQMTDSDFTQKTGINIRFSVMPNEQRLILANAANVNPDIALGISNYIPYDLAIRGAVQDLTEFEDFWEYISKEYNLETLIPYFVEGKVYGVTETQDFYVLFYRNDILESLNLEIPQTWEDVQLTMSTLYRNSMNFYLPMAGWTGLKPFYTTAPFIFQSEGRLYTEDGLKTAINEENSIKGFEIMTKVFTIYSISQSVPNFYNEFRYGRIPLGVSNFTTYVMLMTAAPEIAGQWGIALSPGIKNEKGEILRYQVGSDRADVIFANSTKKQEAWEFLKWWLSKDTQVEYAYRMQTRYGPEYMWNTANMVAFEELAFPEEHKKIILEQWEWIKEIPRHPAGYMVEREISNAWTDVVMNGEEIRIAIDKAAITANREILRKMEEFGYIKNGEVVRNYKIPTIEDIIDEVERNR